MAKCRNLLPVSKLGPFRKWLEEKGIQTADPKGDYQAFHVYQNGHWYALYTRNDKRDGTPREFASIYGPVIDLAKEFLQLSAQ